MAEPLKNMYNPEFFERISPIMESVVPNFNRRKFTSRVFDATWPALELKQRVRHIALALHHFMPEDFPAAAILLTKLAQTFKNNGEPLQSFPLIFLPDYLEVFGLGHPDEALTAIEEVTKLISAEFPIRRFIIRYPEKAMAKMLTWSNHKDANVRRLSSEGCRPRLPWAIGLPQFKKDPTPILPILENLKDDPSEYVRRSVANNLNDIAKDHPDLVLKIAKKWSGKSKNTDAIIRHGCRSLLKKGNTSALSLHGFNHKDKGKIRNLSILKKKVKIGDSLNFTFQFTNEEKKACNFRLEYAIDFITSTGKTSTKVFRITEQKFAPKIPVEIIRKQSFRNLTTRKHFKGKHLLHILVNGKKIISESFIVHL